MPCKGFVAYLLLCIIGLTHFVNILFVIFLFLSADCKTWLTFFREWTGAVLCSSAISNTAKPIPNPNPIWAERATAETTKGLSGQAYHRHKGLSVLSSALKTNGAIFDPASPPKHENWTGGQLQSQFGGPYI